MSRLANNNTIGGLAILAFGVAYLITGSAYPLGTLRSMGAGYFPLIIGWLTILTGAIIACRGLFRGGDHMQIAWRPTLAISASIAAFGIFMALLGLAAAVFAAVTVSTTAERPFAPLRVVALSTTLIAMAYIIFVVVLGMPIPLVRFP
ncbi:tripartite tricarboxylate transporter TctB family protein [Roseibium sp. MMSF_3544]|uniref:tripartite tricarboxylate transporter TctB family protein n=1 Tax=unclassified Roseibium TaxID=2629323 RepID=UPI00273E4271|nr:tripartite tricarboxylate transporter TctB family protein [Roseibium sp. MMSF_3544]